jgi:hypothetical protein
MRPSSENHKLILIQSPELAIILIPSHSVYGRKHPKGRTSCSRHRQLKPNEAILLKKVLGLNPFLNKQRAFQDP